MDVVGECCNRIVAYYSIAITQDVTCNTVWEQIKDIAPSFGIASIMAVSLRPILSATFTLLFVTLAVVLEAALSYSCVKK
jgi:hypothetical protein